MQAAARFVRTSTTPGLRTPWAARRATAYWSISRAGWTAGGGQDNGPIGGIIVTTLNGTTSEFPKGAAIQKWLTGVGALGQNGVPAGELSIYQPRYNTTVTPLQPKS